MKWGTFKEIINSQISDETDIAYIDCSSYKPTVHFENGIIYIIEG